MEIVFYRSKENPDYYLLYKGRDGMDAERMLRRITNTGEFENSGFEKIEVELGYILKTTLTGDFFDFLVENISTNQIAHPRYNDGVFQAWHEFKKYEPEKWLKQYQSFQNARVEELMKNTQQGLQIKLF